MTSLRKSNFYFLATLFVLVVAAVVNGFLISTSTSRNGSKIILANNNNNNPFRIVGYLPEYRLNQFPFEDVMKSGITHIIFFSLEIDKNDGSLQHLERLPSIDLLHSISSLKKNNNISFLFSIGGAGRSEGFLDVVKKINKRNNLIQSILKVLDAYNLDGVDFNWEYPRIPLDWTYYCTLIRETKEAIDSNNNNNSNNNNVYKRVVSIALHPDPSIAMILQANEVLPFIDFINWMSYDNIIFEKKIMNSFTNKMEVLNDAFTSLFDTKYYIRKLKELRISNSLDANNGNNNKDHREKINLGIPLYGIHKSNSIPPETYGNLIKSAILFYNQSYLLAIPNATATNTANNNKNNKSTDIVDFLKSLDEFNSFSFNSIKQVENKMDLSRCVMREGKGIGGIMLWELGQDLLPPSFHFFSIIKNIGEKINKWKSIQDPCAHYHHQNRQDVKKAFKMEAVDQRVEL